MSTDDEVAVMPRRASRRFVRYGIVAMLVIALGGILVARELRAGGVGGRESGALGLIGEQPVKLGAVAPDFALAAPDGKVVRLSDFRGKTVVLNFWATWCPPCRSEIPDLQRAYLERAAKGDLVVLGVDMQEASAPVGSFVKEFDITYPVVLDAKGTVTQHYGLRGLPGTFFIDRNGVIRKQSLGPVGTLLAEGIAAADAAGAPPS